LKVFPRAQFRTTVECFLLLSILSAHYPPPTLHARSQDPSKTTIYIRVNQLGYKLRDPKIAIAFSANPFTTSFIIANAETKQIVFKGDAKPLDGKWGQFSNHAELDFSALAKPGRYFIQIDKFESPAFAIKSDIYVELPDQGLQFMRQQRCGYNPWLDAVCHSFDGRTAYGPLPSGTYLNCSGGWHDAGDLLKYLLTSSNATAQLLLAYELTPPSSRPRVFQDRFNAFGQPGANGTADILDEARWGLDWMLKLHPAKDQLYHQVADDRDHRGWRLPQNETVDYGWGAGSYRVVYFADGKPQGLREFKSKSDGVANLAGRYAAAMALGYQVWHRHPALHSYAQTLLKAAREVYELGRTKEGVQQGNSYGAPYRYEETTWADDMEWGAAELFRATRERKFLQDSLRYARLSATESWMGRQEAGHYQYYPFLNVGHYRLHGVAPPAEQKQLSEYYREGLRQTLAMAEKNVYQVGVPFIWCSNNLVVALTTQALLYEKMTGDTRFRSFASKQNDWLHGRNPWGTSMFTEIPGEGVYPRDVHLMATAILKRPVKGGLVDGPVYRKIFQSLRGVSITEPDSLAAFQDDFAVYHDDIKDYSTNEPTMDGTASAILMWALQAN
jgi:hypothetical protein